MRDATQPIGLIGDPLAHPPGPMAARGAGMIDGQLVPLAPAARARRPRAAGALRFGEYEVLAPLARGGMGGVYLAAHAETGARVALKVIDQALAGHPEVVARLHAEHALAASTSHPGVVAIHAARVAADSTPYLVMEYLDGETLGALAARGRLELATAVAIGAQVAAALAALHAAGVVHCDVKHDNVFVLDARAGVWPRVKLIDFGVSRRITDDPLPDNAIAGTPWCMAPEQWHGHPEPASDVYALGCLLYDLVTGEPPFDGSLPELMLAHLERRPARPSWLARMPAELERLIVRALAKDPRDRPTMAEVACALTALADALAPATQPIASDLRRSA